MLKSLLPREVEFFKFFQQLADELVASTIEFRSLVRDPANGMKHVQAIADHEHKGDEITHSTMKLLHHTFITPIDREDIHSLIVKLDDVIDFIHAAAQRFRLYEIKAVPLEMEMLADLCVRMAGGVKEVVERLEQLKQPEKILEICITLHNWENEADHFLRTGLARLFREEQDIKNLLKLKEAFELVESATDRCEDVANIIEGIVLENA